MPRWFQFIASMVAVLVIGLLLAGIVSVPARAMRAPTGYDQPRVHLNTKNTSRFDGSDASEVAIRVSQAMFPATTDLNRPDVVILFEPGSWQSGLAAASLLRGLNAVLLPATGAMTAEIERLNPQGSAALEGAQLLLIDDAPAPDSDLATQRISSDEIPELRASLPEPPRHVLIVDPDDHRSALLAAPWIAYSGDLVIFDAEDAPEDLPRYALGSAEATDATRIFAESAAALSVEFARFEDGSNPLFGWGIDEDTRDSYRAFTLANPASDPAIALMSANLATRGKVGPLLWAGERTLPQVINNYAWSQRPAFWEVPNEGPFHHFFVLGDTGSISFPAQAQADYAIEIGPYKLKGNGLAGMDVLATIWVVLGIASALWVAFHQSTFLPQTNWLMRLAWPMLALMSGPFGILLYVVAYRRPVLSHGQMIVWDRPLWLQGLVASVSSVGFGGNLMVATGFLLWFFGIPLFPNDLGVFFLLGTPMILLMIANYVVAVLVSWPLYQTPMLAMFHGRSYGEMLLPALPVVLVSMASVSLAMFPSMWWLMMWKVQMTPSEESILWFGIMFFTVFLGLLISWPFNYLFARRRYKSGLM